MVSALAAEGLSRTDSERVVNEFGRGVASCLFEAARRGYERQGMGSDIFLDEAERAWVQTFQYFTSKSVRSAALPCVINAGQQAGIPVSTMVWSGGNDLERINPAPATPAWASDMKTRIGDHIASHPEAHVTSFWVQCEENGCTVLLSGRDIRIFDLEFEVFAEQNGFTRAVPAGGGDVRRVWLER
jgi:hypothetical protein